MKMSTHVAIFLLTLLVAGLHLPARSSTPDLYAAEAPVTDESVAERKKSMSEAFHQVLIKVTGNRAVAGRSGVPELINQASDYVQQYRFRVQPPENDGGVPARFIWVRFDKESTEQALNDLGIPSWNAARPRVLLWLAQDRGGQRSLVNLEQFDGAERQILQTAELRALPVKLPLMDLQDQSGLSAADVWTGYEAGIAAASARYTHDVVLAGKLSSKGGQWRGSWTLYDNGSAFSFQGSGKDLFSVLADGVDRTADKLSEQYAPAAAGDALDQLQIRIVEVDELADYAQVLQIVQGQDAVARLAVNRGVADDLLLDVWVHGSPEVLERGLELGGRLVREADIPDSTRTELSPGSSTAVSGPPSQKPQLTYRLQ